MIWSYYGTHTKVISEEFNDPSTFSTSGWTTKPNIENKVSTCGPYQLFGGYNVFG